MDDREKRGSPRAVLLSIRDYVRLAVPEPESLRIIGKESKQKARISSVQGRSIRSSKSLAKQRSDDPASLVVRYYLVLATAITSDDAATCAGFRIPS
jgi:hypothetical protein